MAIGIREILGALGLGTAGAYDLWGGGSRLKKFRTKTRRQEGLLDQLIQDLGMEGGLGEGYGQSIDYLKELMDPSSEAVSRFTDPYMKQFEQQTVPGLAERFAGAGALGGGLSSSGFGQSLSAAGGNLQSQLAALKAGLGQQAAGQLMSQYGTMTGQALGIEPFGYQQAQPLAFLSLIGKLGQSPYTYG